MSMLSRIGRLFNGPTQNGKRHSRGARADVSDPGGPENSAPSIWSGIGSYFEALRSSRDRTPVPVYPQDPRSISVSAGRFQLSALGTYLYDNYGMVGYAINQIANYSAPIRPQANSLDAGWNTQAEDYFYRWAKRADFTGRFDFWMLQRLACKAIDTSGDIGAMMVNEVGFPQLQMVEGWRIGPNITQGNRRIYDGVEIDSKGRVLGYWIEELTGARGIPADQLLLLYDPDRFGSYRGISPLRRGMNDIRDAQDIKAFEKIATTVSSALVAALEGGPLEEDVWGNDTGTDGNAPPTDATPQQKKLAIAELLGGDIPVLPPGTKLQQLDNKRPGSNVEQWIGTLIGHFVAGLDLPPSFFLDEKVTGPNQRAINGKAQRKFDQRQEMLARFVEWTWIRVIGDAIAKSDLPSIARWDELTLQGPPRISIDEGDRATQERTDVQGSLMTRRKFHGNRGDDWQRETDQVFTEDDYVLTGAQKLAQKFNLPLGSLLFRYGFGQQSVPTATTPAETAPASAREPAKKE